MIIAYEDIEALAEILKKAKQKLVLTNGAFDLVHAGHLTYLEAAKKQGDILIVGINSDASVKGYKSSLRPIIPEAYRAQLMDSLKFVDYVVIFPELTAHELISRVKPDVYVKGGDYTPESLPEYDAVKAVGGEVKFIKMVEGCSTTEIIKKIQKIYGKES